MADKETEGGNDHGLDAASRLAAIVSSSQDAIVGETLDGIITDWNRGAEVIYGYSAEEVVGRSITLLHPSGLEGEEDRLLRRIREGERIENIETRRRRKDGTVIDVAVSISPVYGQDGRLIGASKIARDISAAKQAQAALLE